jgi:hypothetical protein
MLNADALELGRTCHAMAGEVADSFETSAFVRAAASELFPLWLLRHIPNLAAAHASIHLDAQGPSNTIATGCVAGANAIGEAARLIARGEADVMLAGGTDARVSPLGTLRYRDLGWLATREDIDPSSVSAPFDEEGLGVHQRGRGRDSRARVARSRAPAARGSTPSWCRMRPPTTRATCSRPTSKGAHSCVPSSAAPIAARSDREHPACWHRLRPFPATTPRSRRR